MDGGPVTVRRDRALPFLAQLTDGDSQLVSDVDLSAPPVIQVWYEYGTPAANDVTNEALPVNASTDGNQFFFDGVGTWHLSPAGGQLLGAGALHGHDGQRRSDGVPGGADL